MQIKDVRPESYTKQLRCDRCGLLSEIGDAEFAEFITVDMKAGYGSTFGDGNDVQIDLCQHCVKTVLGEWLKITHPDDRIRDLQDRLNRFDPERHGGEFPTSEPGSPKRRLGFLKGTLIVPEDFDAPLPQDVLEDRPHWNLRVIQFDAGEDSYSAVHEVFYETDGRLRGYSEQPAIVMWTVEDEPGAPARALDRIRRALAEPPLTAADFWQ